nr:hypothetical protein [Tanacetum cinerariifolium]
MVGKDLVLLSRSAWKEMHIDKAEPCKSRVERSMALPLSLVKFLEEFSGEEVILNSDSPIPTRVIDGVVQPVAPTTAEQRLAKKNELKARDQCLDDLFKSLKIYDAEIDSDDLEEMDLKWQMAMLTMRARRWNAITATRECRSPKDTKSPLPLSVKIGSLTQKMNLEGEPMLTQKVDDVKGVKGNWGYPHHALKDKGVIDSGCSRHVTGNMSYLFDFEKINGGYVAFGRNPKGGKITRKGKIRTGKFDGKADEGFLVGYSENQPNVAGSGPTWLFDIDTLTKTMNYQPVTAGNQPNFSAGIQEHFDADKERDGNVQQYVLFPPWSSGSKDPQNTYDDTTFEVKEPESKVHVSPSSSVKTKKHDDKTKREAKGKSLVELSTRIRNLSEEFEDFSDNSINEVNAASTPVPAVRQISTNSTNTFSAAGPSNTVVSPTLRKSSYVDPSQYPDDPNMPTLEDITYYDDEEDVGAEADFSNLQTSIPVSPIPTTKAHNDHPVTQIIGHTQEEGIDYEEVFAPVARIESIRLFLAYASFMRFMVYQIDVKSAFFYGTIKEEVYVYQPPGFEDPDYPDKVYKVVKALYGLHQAHIAWYETLANYLLENSFHRGQIDQTLFIKKQKGDILLVQKQDGIFISQDKYVAKILRKFGLTDKKSPSTPIDTKKPLLKDLDGEDVDVHTYRSMIGSLMYLNSSRPDIMFAVCACARFQVTPKASHLHAVKRIFRYLKGKPHLGLWYPEDSPFNLVAYSYSDYAGASLDRKSTIGGCQFLGFHQALHLDDAESIDCLPNEEIFAELARMGYEKPSTKLTFYKLFFLAQWKFLIHKILQCMYTKRTAWNEFSSFMASAVICLATGKTFNFSKYIFDSLVRNVDSSSKFYMYLRFLHLMISAHVGDISSHTTKYTSPALTQKVFANMRRVRKGFSGVDTPLFEGMLVPQQATDDVVDVVADDVVVDDVADVFADADTKPTPPSPPHATTPPPPQQEVTSILPLSPNQYLIAPPSSHPPQQQPSHDVAILMDLLNTLLETWGIIAELDANEDVILEEVAIEVEKDVEDDELELAKLKEVIEVVTTAKLMTKVVTAATTTITAALSAARRRKGIVIIDPEEIATPSTIIEQDEAYARELETKLNKNINWDDVIEHVKRKEKQDNAFLRYQALKRKPQTEAQARKNMMVYLKNMDGFKMDFFKGMSYDDIRPIFEKHFNFIVGFLEKSEKELEEEASKALKRKSKALSSKQSKSKSLMEREDLEMLWKIVQERFASSKPKNFSNDFLLTTRKAMFEKPDVKAHIWKNQRGTYGLAKVKSWKLLESCGVHIIKFTTTQMILLVERRYLLTSFGVDVVEDFKEYTLRDYYWWLKTYCCWYKLKLLDNATDSRLRLLEESATADDKIKK